MNILLFSIKYVFYKYIIILIFIFIHSISLDNPFFNVVDKYIDKILNFLNIILDKPR